MSAASQCRRVEDLLDRFTREGVADPVPAELEEAFAHFEQCVQCGLSNSSVQEILGAVGDTFPTASEDAVFSKNLAQVMEAVRAEPEAPANDGVSGLRRPAASRVGRIALVSRLRAPGGGRLAVGFALAASVAILVTAFLFAGSSPTGELVAVGGQGTRPVLVAVETVDAGELVESDDAWLLASTADVGLGFDDKEGYWRVEELSNDELDSLEGLMGAIPGLG